MFEQLYPIPSLFATVQITGKMKKMNRRRVLFWVFIGCLLLIDGFLLLYQSRIQKPKADITPSLVPSLSKTALFPQPYKAPSETVPEIKLGKAQKIFTLPEDYNYAYPVLLKREKDYLLFLARGKSSLRLNEIVYFRSEDLNQWTKPEVIWSDKYKHIIDLEGQKTKKGFFLFFITEQEQKTQLNYLLSPDGINWEAANLPDSNQRVKTVALLEDKNALRLLVLSQDQKIIRQSFSSDGKHWSAFKEAVRLNLKVNDIAALKIGSHYFLFMTINNELFYTSSLDFYSFAKPTSLLTLPDSSFALSADYLLYTDQNSITLRKLR